MKKITSIAWLMAVAITGLGFTSCSSADEAEVNPNYDPVAGTVNADFVFNVSTGNSTQSRMTSANTQATTAETFRGIDNAWLFAYKQGTSKDGKHIATATTADKSYPLGTLLAANTLDPDGTNPPKSRRILELSLPVETNTLMFWGKAPKTTDDGHVQGKISFNASNKDITNHAFSLQRILDTDKTTEFAQYEELIVTILNAISNATYHADANALVWTVDQGGDGVTKNTEAIGIKWGDVITGSQTAVSGAASTLAMRATSTLSTVTPGQNDELSALGEISGKAALAFHKIWQGELRSGSGNAVHYMLKDLYTAMHQVASATPTSYNELIIKQMANEVERILLLVIDTNGNYKDVSQIKTNFSKTSLTSVTQSLDNFPTAFGLPAGGAQLLCAVTTKDGSTPFSATWSYNQNPVGPGTGTVTPASSTGTFSAATCMYPAELCYFGNSPIHATDDVKTVSDYPDGSGTATGEWMDATNWTGWTKNSHVKSTSRAVAMAHNINYGTAVLKTTVSYGAGTITDNNAAIQLARNSATEADKNISVSAANDRFILKGIMIGGQEQTMGWNYIAKSDAPTFNCVVYDNNIVAPNIPAYGSTAMDPTYTLVWDNYNPTIAANASQQKVYVALELENNTGESFWGRDNLIRAGGTFYLIGVLDPTKEGLTAVTFPTADMYHLPPYKTDVATDNAAYGTTIQAQRVFIQDYMTSANFVIGVNSLKSAYVTVPDLRSTQISLGLSVDLNWSQGLNFGDVTLGD